MAMCKVKTESAVDNSNRGPTNAPHPKRPEPVHIPVGVAEKALTPEEARCLFGCLDAQRDSIVFVGHEKAWQTGYDVFHFAVRGVRLESGVQGDGRQFKFSSTGSDVSFVAVESRWEDGVAVTSGYSSEYPRDDMEKQACCWQVQYVLGRPSVQSAARWLSVVTELTGDCGVESDLPRNAIVPLPGHWCNSEYWCGFLSVELTADTPAALRVVVGVRPQKRVVTDGLLKCFANSCSSSSSCAHTRVVADHVHEWCASMGERVRAAVIAATTVHLGTVDARGCDVGDAGSILSVDTEMTMDGMDGDRSGPVPLPPFVCGNGEKGEPYSEYQPLVATPIVCCKHCGGSSVISLSASRGNRKILNDVCGAYIFYMPSPVICQASECKRMTLYDAVADGVFAAKGTEHHVFSHRLFWQIHSLMFECGMTAQGVTTHLSNTYSAFNSVFPSLHTWWSQFLVFAKRQDWGYNFQCDCVECSLCIDGLTMDTKASLAQSLPSVKERDKQLGKKTTQYCQRYVSLASRPLRSDLYDYHLAMSSNSDVERRRVARCLQNWQLSLEEDADRYRHNFHKPLSYENCSVNIGNERVQVATMGEHFGTVAMFLELVSSGLVDVSSTIEFLRALVGDVPVMNGLVRSEACARVLYRLGKGLPSEELSREDCSNLLYGCPWVYSVYAREECLRLRETNLFKLVLVQLGKMAAFEFCRIRVDLDPIRNEPRLPRPTDNSPHGVFYGAKFSPRTIRRIPKYDIDSYPKETSCHKGHHVKKDHTGGCIMMWCATCGQCLGFHMHFGAETHNDIFCIIFGRMEVAPRYIIYDDACCLMVYCMRREPRFFQNTQFFVDRYHWKNHVSCGESMSLLTASAAGFDALRFFDSQAAEQGNSRLREVRKSVGAMKVDTFLTFVRLFLEVWNRKKIGQQRRFI